MEGGYNRTVATIDYERADRARHPVGVNDRTGHIVARAGKADTRLPPASLVRPAGAVGGGAGTDSDRHSSTSHEVLVHMMKP